MISFSPIRDAVIFNADFVIGLLLARNSPRATSAHGEAEPPSNFKNCCAGSGKGRPLAEYNAPKNGDISNGFLISERAVLAIICSGEPVRCWLISIRMIAKANVTQTVMIVAIVVTVREAVPKAKRLKGKPI